MFLPAAMYQPSTDLSWDIPTSAEVFNKYFSIERRSYNLDPIFMGDFRQHVFLLEVMDTSTHNFYMQTMQMVISRKCFRVADEVSDEPRRVYTRLLGDQATAEDLSFTFSVLKIDGCADEYKNNL